MENLELLELLRQENNKIIEKNERLIQKNKLIIRIIECVGAHANELGESKEGRSFLKDFYLIFAKEV